MASLMLASTADGVSCCHGDAADHLAELCVCVCEKEGYEESVEEYVST